jgi:integrase
MLLTVMAYAGLRLGEALAMRAEFFDPVRRTYFVSQSYKGNRFGEPKSGRSRLVDLPDFLVTELEAFIGLLRKESLRTGGAGRVDLLFVDPAEDGVWPFSQRKAQSLVARVCKAALLRVSNPHDLRHTYATMLLMAHQSPAYVQR